MKKMIENANNESKPQSMMAQKHLKVAVIHDWLVVYGGAERVLEHILDSYPQADLFSLIDHVPQEQREFLRGKKPRTSFLQKIPGIAKHYSKFLPLMPLAIEQFDLSGYDLIISSSYCVAKGVLNGPNQMHVSYCHSPMRYAWDHYHEYLSEMNMQTGPKSWFARWQLHKIRTWDTRSSNTVDQFVANSKFVKARIKKFYGRDAHLIYPPVETSLFSHCADKEEFYVAAGRFVPFKRLDLAVDAFTRMPQKKLVMIGDGPDMEKLRSRAGPNVEFLGFQPPEVMRDYLSRAKAFIFPSEEDFGIVPVEAQACGTPVIAFGSGGALETVINVDDDNPAERATGVWFAQQSPESLANAVAKFERLADEFDTQFISKHAASFSPENFKEQLVAYVQKSLEQREYVPIRVADTPEHITLIEPLEGEEAPDVGVVSDDVRETSRFGVPVVLASEAVFREKIAITTHQRVISAVSECELRQAGHDRDFQYALNQSDLVVPYDAETSDWLSEKTPGANRFDGMKRVLINCLTTRKVGVLHDPKAVIPDWLNQVSSVVELVPDTHTKNVLLSKQLKTAQIEVVVVVSSEVKSFNWLQESKAGFSAKLFVTLPGSSTVVRSPALRVLRDLVDSPAAEASPNRWWQRQMLARSVNRGINIASSAAGLFLLLPLLVLTALAIRLESRGPILFKQQRVGYKGETFTMYKFRSMYIDAEDRLNELLDRNESVGAVTFKMKGDPRITRVGKHIRKLSIDELPQLFNVLRGDMNLVGPRPALPTEVANYSFDQRKRLQVKPGITCLWQVSGRSELSFEEQVDLDLEYAGRQGLLEDVSILARTVPAVLTGRGAY